MQRTAWLAAACFLLAGAAGPVQGQTRAEAAPPADSPAGRLAAMEAQSLPWQGGRNNGAAEQGFVFTVPPVDALADFHGSTNDPALVLYASGNYYFAMGPLVAAFGNAYPRYRNKVYFETLPPGLLLKQIAAGGMVTVGNMSWTVKPDVLLAELGASQRLERDGKLTGDIVAFATNDLTIMVPAGNPGHVASLADLARPDLAVSMPNPQFEGVAQQIRASLAKAGGEQLADAVYSAKVRTGMTVLTRIHHRQTPLLMMQGLVQAGVTWTSEAIFQEQAGHPISHVAIPAAQNTRAIYSAAELPGAPHPEAARDWLKFIRSDAAFAILARYGFQRYAGAGQ
ncbi:MAG: substrate-binding domain-containing protein [Acetobacteraceae bacterium]|nr:substrate-binding domain-containing protein [Acetobacteraceae bacterium]